MYEYCASEATHCSAEVNVDSDANCLCLGAWKIPRHLFKKNENNEGRQKQVSR